MENWTRGEVRDFEGIDGVGDRERSFAREGSGVVHEEVDESIEDVIRDAEVSDSEIVRLGFEEELSHAAMLKQLESGSCSEGKVHLSSNKNDAAVLVSDASCFQAEETEIVLDELAERYVFGNVDEEGVSEDVLEDAEIITDESLPWVLDHDLVTGVNANEETQSSSYLNISEQERANGHSLLTNGVKVLPSSPIVNRDLQTESMVKEDPVLSKSLNNDDDDDDDDNESKTSLNSTILSQIENNGLLIPSRPVLRVGDPTNANSVENVVEDAELPDSEFVRRVFEEYLAQAEMASQLESGGCSEAQVHSSSNENGGTGLESYTYFQADETEIVLDELAEQYVFGDVEEEGSSVVVLDDAEITTSESLPSVVNKDLVSGVNANVEAQNLSYLKILDEEGTTSNSIATNGYSPLTNGVKVSPSPPSLNRDLQTESMVKEDPKISRYPNDDYDNDDNESDSSPNSTIVPQIENSGPSVPSRPISAGDPTNANSVRGTESERESPNRLIMLEAPHPASVRGPSLPSRPTGLGSYDPLHSNAARSVSQTRPNGSVSLHQSLLTEESAGDDADENKETHEKLQMIRVKFLRLAHRLGQTPHNVVVAQVLYRIGLAEQLWKNTNRAGAFGYDRANVMAEQLEAAGQEPLDFTCTIMAIGKSGVGKSATINSIFDDVQLGTDAFQSCTKKVHEIVGTVQGIKVRVIDTPGISACSSEQFRNEKILQSIKKFIVKSAPDIILYFDRLDTQSRDYGDVPLLRSITNVFGPSIWFNAIVVLTHAASAPPDGPNGNPMTYEMFVTQRSHVVQQAIRQAAGDVRLMNPVSLVENHSACRMNRAGQRVLPNGQVWKPQLLLLSFASKILAEANMLLKLQDSPPGRPLGSRARVPPLPFLLSNLLQSKPRPRLPDEPHSEDDPLDDDLDEASDSSGELDYDDLPPFKRLMNSQLDKLSKEQRKAYYEELEYREKLYFKKQLMEEKKQQKLMKKMAEASKDLPHGYDDERLEEEIGGGGPASVPVPMPDLVLPHSFDSDYPSHRYRFLDTTSNQWLIRPVLEAQVWDHDVGYDGLNVERLFVLRDEIPVSASGQLTKDKKEFNLQMELGASVKHAEGKTTSLGMDVHTLGKDMAYTLRGETRFRNFKRNNTTAGLTLAVLGDTVSTGVKVEDKLVVNKRFKLLASGGAMTGRGDVAYGGRLEATLRDKDYPIGQDLSTVALSIVDWHGEQVIGCNLQSQIRLARGTNVIGHANISNRGSGQVGIRLSSSEHLQIALLVLFPLIRNIKRVLLGSSESA